MSTHPVHALNPVFEFLDGLIRDQGDILFTGFAPVPLAVIVWILCGGMRRKSRGESAPEPPVVFIHLPGSSPPPAEEFNPFPPPREPDGPDDDRHWD